MVWRSTAVNPIRDGQLDKEGADLIGVAQCVLWAGADPGGAGGLIGGDLGQRLGETQNGALGQTWHHPFDMELAKGEGCQLLRVEMGRLVLLPQMKVGQSFWYRAERLLATRTGDGEWTIRRDDGLCYHLGLPPPNCHLRLTRIDDGNGNSIRAHYDAAGQLKQITGSDAIRYLFSSDPAGRFTSISKTDGAARIRLASYDCNARGDLVRATDAAGQAFGYAYDRHLLIHETRKTGLSFHFP